MIRLENVTKWYPTNSGRRYVLRNVTLNIPENINIGILGRNGAGKSTLIRMLGGIDFPNEGRIVTNSKVSPPFGLARAFANSLTGRENAKFVCRVQGDTRDEVKRRVEVIKEFSELGNYFDMPVRSYSSGMRARLAFSVSIAFDYDYYLIDELVAVGDQRFRRKAVSTFSQKRGKSSFILVSHNLKLHREECDAGIYLKDGEAIFYRNIRQAIRAYVDSEG